MLLWSSAWRQFLAMPSLFHLKALPLKAVFHWAEFCARSDIFRATEKSWTAFNFVAAQFWRKITLRAQNSPWWKTGLKSRSCISNSLYTAQVRENRKTEAKLELQMVKRGANMFIYWCLIARVICFERRNYSHAGART